MNQPRKKQALKVRIAAAKLAADRPHPIHVANDDELKFRHVRTDVPSYLMSYTKGLPHDKNTGLILNSEDFQKFVRAIDSGDPRDFQDTPLGDPNNVACQCKEPRKPKWRSEKANNPRGSSEPVNVRAWESQSAGLTFDLEGPDAQAVTMPPAPDLGSAELTAEMGEVYVQALLRDVPFIALAHGTEPDPKDVEKVKRHIDQLKGLPWFNDKAIPQNEAEKSRQRTSLTPFTAFRGITPGDQVGPYISQFLLIGNTGINSNDSEREAESGLISYGAISIDQKVRFATPEVDYMIHWDEWLDVQNGADLRNLEEYEDEPKRRFITTPRDLATYVHYDALYEAYLNACIILLANGMQFDPGIPFQSDDLIDHQQGFAQFGGPHILTLVTEVATRALKAVRFQKFNVHRRLRPEALAARLAKSSDLYIPELQSMTEDLKDIIADVRGHNNKQTNGGSCLALLPMAFCEGSPMHPSYGAGHAAVAGACVTILKAFFDHKQVLPFPAFVPDSSGTKLVPATVYNAAGGSGATLTVEGELNKLASNISIGRDWAGVHYFSDYIESLRLGEKIAIGILEEQKLTYGENFSMTVPLFDGGSIRI